MGWASQSGHAITSPDNPRAFAKCDGCQMLYNHHVLRWQREWSGTKIINKGFLVCPKCLDKPNPQLKARLMPPDPVPIANPRPETYRYPLPVDHVGVEPPPPAAAVATEVDAARNWPAGAPLQVEPWRDRRPPAAPAQPIMEID
jgi:hypothetical protein